MIFFSFYSFSRVNLCLIGKDFFNYIGFLKGCLLIRIMILVFLYDMFIIIRMNKLFMKI